MTKDELKLKKVITETSKQRIKEDESYINPLGNVVRVADCLEVSLTAEKERGMSYPKRF